MYYVHVIRSVQVRFATIVEHKVYLSLNLLQLRFAPSDPVDNASQSPIKLDHYAFVKD